MPLHLVAKTAKNVLGEELAVCNCQTATGFYRDGLCNTSAEDVGSHTVCVVMTDKFLEYSRFRGNDLSTARPELGFSGLKAGDKWCLCAARWLEAYRCDMAPMVYLAATHEKAVDIIDIDYLKQNAIDSG